MSPTMVRVVSFNANGIRAAARKGLFTRLRATSPDVLCMQETKAQEHQVPPESLALEEYNLRLRPRAEERL